MNEHPADSSESQTLSDSDHRENYRAAREQVQQAGQLVEAAFVNVGPLPDSPIPDKDQIDASQASTKARTTFWPLEQEVWKRWIASQSINGVQS